MESQGSLTSQGQSCDFQYLDSQCLFFNENNRKMPIKNNYSWFIYLHHPNKKKLSLEMHSAEIKDSKNYIFCLGHRTN